MQKTLAPRAEICRLGWAKFELWCLENVEGGEAGIDAMALHYRDLRDEATTNQANRLTGPEALQLDVAVKAVTNWLYARSLAAGAYKGGSIYSHLGPRLTAQLADVKHECVLDWSSSADTPTNQWPESYEDMASQPLIPLTGDPKALRGPQTRGLRSSGGQQGGCANYRDGPPKTAKISCSSKARTSTPTAAPSAKV